MSESLLAYLYSHIRGSQEDIATLSLQYIISQHPCLRDCFNKLLGTKLHSDLSEVSKYTCQATGDNLERPDLAGTDKEGKELVLCEAKFYAGLTDNQPISYLNRLRDEEGKGLVFICPEVRVTSLWSKLQERCFNYELEIMDKSCVSVNGIRMAIISWNEILTELQRIAVATAPEALSDLSQLIGYCKEMDAEAFIPYSSEDLGVINARKQQRNYRVVNETMDLILADKSLEATKVGKSSYYYGGFERKVRVPDFEFNLAYDEFLWLSTNSKETPFWLAIKDKNGKQTQKILTKLQSFPDFETDGSIYSLTYIALEPLTNATLDEVAKDLKAKILYYLEILKNNLPNSKQ